MNRGRALIFAILAIIALSFNYARAADDHVGLSFYGYGNLYEFPGFLFDFENGLTKHPHGLFGYQAGFDGMYEFAENYSIGIGFVGMHASGEGKWVKEKEMAENGVDGFAYGRTDLNLWGGMLSIKRQFLENPIRPYIKLGVGGGDLRVNFKGRFVGHETQSGQNMPIEEPAEDEVTRIIPLISLEAGIDFEITEHFYFGLDGFWNTGYGGGMSLSYSF